MMKRLSETEMSIMEELWKIGKPVSAKELEQIFLLKQKKWKIQTISTFLVRMENKKYISHEKKGKAKMYFPIIEKNEIEKIEAKGILDAYYNGSLKKFILALSNKKISEREAEELERWLNGQNEE